MTKAGLRFGEHWRPLQSPQLSKVDFSYFFCALHVEQLPVLAPLGQFRVIIRDLYVDKYVRFSSYVV